MKTKRISYFEIMTAFCITLLILLICALVLFSSCTRTLYKNIETVKHDSIFNKEYVTVHDTLIKPTIQANRVITSKPSHLETDYSFSDAFIDKEGLLNHSIANKDLIPAKIFIKRFDIIKTKTFTNIAYVKKKVPYRDKLFWLSVLLNVAFIGAITLYLKFKR